MRQEGPVLSVSFLGSTASHSSPRHNQRRVASCLFVWLFIRFAGLCLSCAVNNASFYALKIYLLNAEGSRFLIQKFIQDHKDLP